jgi:hypothetical protein
VELELTKWKNIPAVKDATYKVPLEGLIEEISTNLEYILKSVKDIANFRDNTRRNEQRYSCELEYKEINPHLFKTIESAFKRQSKNVDMNLAKAAIDTAPDKLDKLITNLIILNDIIKSERDDLLERLDLMDGLTKDFIPARLPFLLETLACLTSGDLEHVSVNYCDRNSHGLFCEIEVSTQKMVQEYRHYIPVAYKGVQMRAEYADQRFLRADDGSYYILDCVTDPEFDYDEETTLEKFDDCDIKPYINECMKYVWTTNYTKILQHCNFTTFGRPPLITRTLTGILLMGEGMITKELDSDNHVRSIVPNNYPLHIITGNNIAITSGNKEIVLKPYYQPAESKIEYSYLSADFIDNMITQDFFKELTLYDKALMVLAGIVLIISPIMGAQCCHQIRTADWYMKWKDYWAWKKFKNSKGNKDKENYRLNTIFSRGATVNNK